MKLKSTLKPLSLPPYESLRITSPSVCARKHVCFVDFHFLLLFTACGQQFLDYFTSPLIYLTPPTCLDGKAKQNAKAAKEVDEGNKKKPEVEKRLQDGADPSTATNSKKAAKKGKTFICLSAIAGVFNRHNTWPVFCSRF